MASTSTMTQEASSSSTARVTETATGTSKTEAARLAGALLAHAPYPPPAARPFAFTPFLQQTYHHGLPADRPVCKAYSAGHCPLGSRCPDRHVSSAAAAANQTSGGGGREGGFGFNSLVCKHWLRGLCKKGEGCEFLHEYNLRKMPECNFFLRNGYCSNGDECLYLHIDPRSKLPPCPDYDNRGFCALGPDCPKKHVRRAKICPYYLAGFCPEGARLCKEGAHPKWTPRAVVAPQVAAEKKAAAEAAAAGIDLSGADGATPRSPAAGGDDDYGSALDEDGGFGGGGRQYQQHHQHHFDSEEDRERPSRGDFRGGFGRGRGGRWRGRGGRGFRGRGH